MNHNSYEENILQNKFLLENIQGGIVYSDFDPPFHLRYCTEGMAKLSGYTPEELIELTQVDIVIDEDLPTLVEDVNRQFACGDTFEVEYRLKRKDGSFLYVLDRAKVVLHEDGKKYIHCLLTDITDLKEMERELRLNQKKYQIAIEQSGKAIFEYNSLDRSIQFSDNYKHLFGCNPPTGTLQEILNGNWVVSKYQKKLLKLIANVSKTTTTHSIEFQILTENQKALWCSLYLIPVMEQNTLHSVIGCLENIDEKKNNIQRLTELSEKDSLTGVYNRYAIEKLIQHEINHPSKERPVSALYILDIDYFKQINDEYGHDFGDKILINLSSTVNYLLPEHAVLGRLGGDEFLIFATLKESNTSIDELAQKIVYGVQKQFSSNVKPITISVGGAFTTNPADTFQNLYRNADHALYETKSKGKNGYSIFITI